MSDPGIEMTPLQQLGSRWTTLLVRLRRRLPHLIWYGEEVDVGVTFHTEALDASNVDGAFRQFNGGDLVKVKQILSDHGVEFDSGLGPDGRDWEWDWSLRGPISVRFRCRAQRPERRASKQTMQAMGQALSALRAQP